MLNRISSETRDWWAESLPPDQSEKYQSLVRKISGSTASHAAQREIVMRGLLLKLYEGDKNEADAAWNRLGVLLRSCN